MNDNRISATPAITPDRASAPCRPTIRARLTARLRSGRLDAMLAVGAPTPPGSAIAARAARLTSTSEREAIARALRRCVQEAANDTALWSSRIPLHRKNIAAAELIIDAITLRLHSPPAVNARGMARLNRVINDGLGPLYAFGHGDLTGRLGAALAAL
ncbi:MULTISPECIES: hypothetical protein [unclassified Mycolicibacterium]|uniref:hypothetical protein n=1 Tax=unclassified Mycolicibacterium TaxID=2636767 RepID=UPI0012DEE943|nr:MULTISPECIES: hypothetical protein [unclassified Mycolicibacterium]MUL85476.1 hypothetical protein [Mycolicibacterium sp. CBMA 329]MUL88760.1 hypothetical protein [Mycolicibacterium sp. CBMA 331]MUM01946.1 hypothetical protein [Mycolicibacterium sp. CBMA 334]MUM24851.1 hypothetical protein [Mycolicibacterium sp. CBMA 295]MUM40407.1 hypothetical protein [Mycolicibacterium sp. CBMA 247]